MERTEASVEAVGLSLTVRFQIQLHHFGHTVLGAANTFLPPNNIEQVSRVLIHPKGQVDFALAGWGAFAWGL